MEPEHVDKLEAEIGKAIARVIRRLAKDGAIPEPKGDLTYHFMAKAAVAVFEAINGNLGRHGQ